MIKYIKEINGISHIKDKNQICINRNGMNIYNPPKELLLEEGWKEYNTPVQTQKEIDDINKQKEISDSKNSLENSDYKIIKCMEAYLCGEELPYDIKELHEQRNTYRNKINQYETN